MYVRYRYYSFHDECFYLDSMLNAELFTGLKDKNDIDIYVGDILIFPYKWREYYDDGYTRTGLIEDRNQYGQVVFYDRYGTYGVSIDHDCDQGYIDMGVHSFYGLDEYLDLKDLEVVGNIHQNSELLDT